VEVEYCIVHGGDNGCLVCVDMRAVGRRVRGCTGPNVFAGMTIPGESYR